MKQSPVILNKKVTVPRKTKFKSNSHVPLKKKCHLEVIKHADDCACHKPVTKHRFHRDRCFEIIDGVKPLIQLRLAGLNHGLNFELFRHIGNVVVIEVVSGEKVEKIRGVLSQVGTDYVDIKKADGKVVTILQQHIHKIEWFGRKKKNPHHGGHHADHHADYLDEYGDEHYDESYNEVYDETYDFEE
ncbi:hypothetical protein [Paenibacillus sp. Marseille-Q7038]